ncbi:MAG: acetate--CoA ligase family protein [Deltaproteobacteria bacterium]|nr:acetate--CoA ligase family protein [Deltaproteobacteria bacterium]
MSDGRSPTVPADLRLFFEPRNVAVVGASANPTKWGYYIFHNTAAGGFTGRLFPVNRSGGTLFGHPVLPTVEELPQGEVDLAVVVVPPDQVPGCVEGLARRGVRAAYVVTGGYSETGAAGAARERELAALATRHGLLLAGPNGQGLLSNPVGLSSQMAFARPPRGGLSMITQSGNIGATLMHYAHVSGVGFCRLVSVGNSALLGVEEFLAFLAQDERTTAVALYVEGVRDGRRFADALRDAALRKPVVLLKGGRTPGGAAAALSHTGALAGNADLFGRLVEQLGAVVVPSLDRLFDVAAAFAATPPVAGPRVGVVTVGGGWGVVAADAIQEQGLELPDLPPAVVAELDGVLPDRWSRRNPVDLAGDIGPGAMHRCVQAVVECGAYDAVLHLGGGLVGFAGGLMRESPLYPRQALDMVVEEAARRDQRLGEALARLAGRPDCPLLFASDAASSPTAAQNPGLTALRARGALVYPSPERAVRALAALVRRTRTQAVADEPPPRGASSEAIAGAAARLAAAAAAGRDRLGEVEAAELLGACGVPFAAHRTADDPAGAAAAARTLGYPVVLKGAGGGLAHKSDRGLVLLGLRDDAAVRDGAARLLAETGVEQVVVARQISGRRELLLGWLRDETFGSAGVVGFGGVLTEAVRDAAFVLLPVSASKLRAALGGLRSRALFERFRGEAPADFEALARALNGLWELGRAAPSLGAIDLNPVVLDADGRPTAVDALVTLRPAPGGGG